MTDTSVRKRRRRLRRQPETIRIWFNERKSGRGRTVHVYRSRAHLMTELMQAVADGKRCFVTSNSKTLIQKIAAALTDESPDAKLIEITADTATGEKQKAFLADPAKEALQYQVVLTSPAVGTGVDTTFPDGAQQIDAVFGFCEALITSHFDFDQQIGRVRNPGTIRVWINPRRFNFETNVDAVRFDILRQGLYKDLLIDRNGPGGTERYREDDLFIEMAALITARDRASKNDLLRHFIEHKRTQGFSVEIVSSDEAATALGKSLLSVGERLSDEKRIRKLIESAPLPRHVFDRVRAAIEGGGVVDEADRWSLDRTSLELFYRAQITPDLIRLDQRSRYRSRVSTFERVLIYNSYFELVGPLNRESRFIRTRGDTNAAIARLLRLTPLLNDAGIDPDAVIDGGQLGEFASFTRANRPELENLLGIEIRADLERKPVQQLNRVLNLIGLKLENAGTVKQHGQKIYRYRIDQRGLEQLQRVLAARERTMGWRFLAGLHGWPHDEEDDEDFEEAA
jgi:hypothetical protein